MLILQDSTADELEETFDAIDVVTKVTQMLLFFAVFLMPSLLSIFLMNWMVNRLEIQLP